MKLTGRVFSAETSDCAHAAGPQLIPDALGNNRRSFRWSPVAETSKEVTIRLHYETGRDEPERGIYRNQAIEPNEGGDLLIGYTQCAEPDDVFPENPYQRQVHLVGTAASLEALGTYLIALARLESAEPEVSGSFDEVRFDAGGTIRLLPRRVRELPARS